MALFVGSGNSMSISTCCIRSFAIAFWWGCSRLNTAATDAENNSSSSGTCACDRLSDMSFKDCIIALSTSPSLTLIFFFLVGGLDIGSLLDDLDELSSGAGEDDDDSEIALVSSTLP